MPTGYYDQDFEPWVRGIRSLGTMIMQQPMLRAEAQQRAQQEQLTGARIQGEQAQAGLADARTQEFLQKGKLVTMLEESAAQAQQDFAAGRTDSPAVRQFVAASSALTGINADDIAGNMRKGLGTMLAAQGKGREAAMVDDPNAAFKTTEDNAARERIAENRGMTVAPGAAVWKGGKVVHQQPSAANEEFETETTVYPATPEIPAVPETPAKYGWFGKKKADAVPGTPGVPAQPERRVVRRRKLSSAVAAANGEQGTDMDDEEMPVDEAGPAAGPEVTEEASPQVKKVQNQADIEMVMADANQAIAGTGPYADPKTGKPMPRSRKMVLERLKQMGITLKEQ